MSTALSEEEQARRKKAQEDLPPLPPLLAQILAETRAKQQQKALQKEKGETDGDKAAAEGAEEGDDEAKPASGPLFLEAAPSSLVMFGSNVPERKGRPSDSEDESEAEADQPPGPIDAARCRAHGPGFSGAAAGQPVKLTITARDSNGKRIREGGAHILVMVEPVAAPGKEDDVIPIQAQVVDHGDGTYTASYTVPTKGNYELSIELNGDPLGDSPYPIFFSAPVPVTEAPAPAAPVPAPGMPQQPAMPPGIAMPVPTITASGIQIVTAAAIKEAAAASKPPPPPGAPPGMEGMMAPGTTALAAAYPNIGTGMQVSLGAQLAQMGMRFPELTAEQLIRMVVVGGLTPHATSEALKSVFAFCGTIRSCTVVGPNSGFAFIEFSSAHEAAAALAMSGAQLMGQALKVELASEAKKGADMASTSVANPFMALQAQQVQQFQLLQQQQAALAEQVLAMRAAQRAGTAPANAPNYRSNDSQKSAAIAAAIALSKKLAAGAGAGGGGDAATANGSADRARSRSRSRSRDRSRKDRSRSRDRERDSRKDRSRERRRDRSRDRSRERRRDRSRERRTRRSRSRDRKGRSRSREHKRSHRSRSRDRKHHRDRDHKDRKERRRDRDRSKERDGKRSSRDKEGMDWEPTAAAAGGGDAQAQQHDELEALLDELGD